MRRSTLRTPTNKKYTTEMGKPNKFVQLSSSTGGRIDHAERFPPGNWKENCEEVDYFQQRSTFSQFSKKAVGNFLKILRPGWRRCSHPLPTRPTS